MVGTAGECGVIYSDRAFGFVEACVSPIGDVIKLAEELKAGRIAGRLRCEQPPCGHVWIVLSVDGDGLHLLAAPKDKKPHTKINAPGATGWPS